MIRLYTAVGTFKFNKHGLPTIVCADREYGLTSMELVLWSCLSFRILTYDELRKEFYEKERELHVLSEEEFDQYLNRLLQRKLVVCGEDYVGVDALLCSDRPPAASGGAKQHSCQAAYFCETPLIPQGVA